MNAQLPQFVRDLLSAPPTRGLGLNNWLYRAARVLHPFRTPAEIVDTLAAATAGEQIKTGEIARAVERSRANAWQPGQRVAPTPRATWPKVNQELRETAIATGYGLVDLWEQSPVRFEDSEPHTEQVIDSMFPGDSLLCIGLSNSQFATRSRERLRGRLASLELIVPSPMTARTGMTQDGRESEHTLSNTGARRFLIVEQDAGTADQQAAILLHLAQRAPLVLAVHSGSKSIHGWFFCAGRDEDKLRRFMRAAVSLGADPATWGRAQFVRIPDGLRDGRRQTVYFFNPEVCQ